MYVINTCIPRCKSSPRVTKESYSPVAHTASPAAVFAHAKAPRTLHGLHLDWSYGSSMVMGPERPQELDIPLRPHLQTTKREAVPHTTAAAEGGTPRQALSPSLAGQSLRTGFSKDGVCEHPGFTDAQLSPLGTDIPFSPGSWNHACGSGLEIFQYAFLRKPFQTSP
ncbi:hypothetical protein STEG23_035724 [Scotinomys teguina]